MTPGTHITDGEDARLTGFEEEWRSPERPSLMGENVRSQIGAREDEAFVVQRKASL